MWQWRNHLVISYIYFSQGIEKHVSPPSPSPACLWEGPLGKPLFFVSESRLEQNPSLVQLQRTEESPEVPFIKELWKLWEYDYKLGVSPTH